MGNTIVECITCGAQNRLGSAPAEQIPVCGKCKNSLPWIISGSDITFRKELETSIPVLVDFWAEWCAPCRMTTPVLEELAREKAGQLKILKMNVDQNPATAGQFNIRSIPTLMLFKNGRSVESMVGAMSKTAIGEKLAPYLEE
jgi:thioredoxin 2